MCIPFLFPARPAKGPLSHLTAQVQSKKTASSSPQPWILLYSLLQRLLQRLPNAAIVCLGAGMLLCHTSRGKGRQPRHTESHRIILLPAASRKNSEPLSLPDGMGLGVCAHRWWSHSTLTANNSGLFLCLLSVQYLRCLSFLEKRKKIKWITVPSKSPGDHLCRTHRTPPRLQRWLCSLWESRGSCKGKRMEKRHTGGNPGEFFFLYFLLLPLQASSGQPTPDPAHFTDVFPYGEQQGSGITPGNGSQVGQLKHKLG